VSVNVIRIWRSDLDEFRIIIIVMDRRRSLAPRAIQVMEDQHRNKKPGGGQFFQFA